MKITYLGHSGFLAEMEDACFLFDYYQGGLPEPPKEKKLFVFVSHKHSDHYQREIFRLEERGVRVYYILSKDVRRNVEKFVLGVKKEMQQTSVADTISEAKSLQSTPDIRVTDGSSRLEDRICYMKPDQELEIENCQIRTLRSTDEGVAYLVRYQGRTLYHAGDLNAWYWEEEGEQYNAQKRRDYEGEIRKIGKNLVDVAFVPVDPRLEGEYVSGLDFFMRQAGAKAVFPMHFWGDYGIFERLKKESCTEEYRDRIFRIEQQGQTFELDL